jgi:hypothetical protein
MKVYPERGERFIKETAERLDSYNQLDKNAERAGARCSQTPGLFIRVGYYIHSPRRGSRMARRSRKSND